MKTTIVTIIFFLMLTSCNREASSDVTLVFPTSRYINWTNFEGMYMAFRLTDGKISIDSNYDFESKRFIPGGFEQPANYPAMTEFLKKTLNEYRILSQDIDSANCALLTPIYIEYSDGQITNSISIRNIKQCDTSKRDVSGIVTELWMLKRKYAPLNTHQGNESWPTLH